MNEYNYRRAIDAAARSFHTMDTLNARDLSEMAKEKFDIVLVDIQTQRQRNSNLKGGLISRNEWHAQNRAWFAQ